MILNWLVNAHFCLGLVAWYLPDVDVSWGSNCWYYGVFSVLYVLMTPYNLGGIASDGYNLKKVFSHQTFILHLNVLALFGILIVYLMLSYNR